MSAAYVLPTAAIDLSLYARKSDIPAAPDLAPFAKKTDLPILPDLGPYAKKADIPASLVLPGVFTVDTLPDPATCMDMYATVTDLFGSKRDKVLASKSGTRAFWQPVRPTFRGDMAFQAGTTALGSLKVPSILKVTGTAALGQTGDFVLGPGSFPGQSQRVKRTAGGSGVFRVIPQILTSNVLNLGTPLAILFGATAEWIWDFDNGWEQWT